ncbi:hypothetical protein PAECIP111891_00713 [Paenibacillus allorhizoplanae]|uniref:DUF3923 family protein n=1 Tax=Paenibacillus allorhizoplanae TaxID=2905648 RepID=A0ABM9BVC0_9BACL|nr:hypothetical protein [Paenibacillus allorhizoplanae]CAH1195634.1 hypothetical protein PAECIP111891_00713 [Paenibacillus allorhizoplanae]
MKAYRFGYVLVTFWLIWMFYGFNKYNDVDENKMYQILAITGLGFILFPIYFVGVYVCGVFMKRKT